MKKVIAVILSLIFLATLTLSVGARSLSDAEKDLMAELNKGVTISGTTYYLPASVMTQAENYLKSLDNALTQEQIDQIMDKIEDAKSIVSETGISDPKKWPASVKSGVLSNIDDAANVLGLSAVANSNDDTITIVDSNNKEIVTNGKIIKKTGMDLSPLFIVAAAGMLVLGACVLVSKKTKLI